MTGNLILGRKVGQAVTVRCPCGCTVEIAVITQSHVSQRLRLAFRADTAIRIHRNELLQPEELLPEEKTA